MTSPWRESHTYEKLAVTATALHTTVEASVRPGHSISAQYSPDKTEDFIMADMGQSRDFLQARVDKDVSEFKMNVWCTRLGRFAKDKVVGPPTLKWPQVGVKFSRKPITVAVWLAWRDTGHTFVWMAKGKP